MSTCDKVIPPCLDFPLYLYHLFTQLNSSMPGQHNFCLYQELSKSGTNISHNNFFSTASIELHVLVLLVLQFFHHLTTGIMMSVVFLTVNQTTIRSAVSQTTRTFCDKLWLLFTLSFKKETNKQYHIVTTIKSWIFSKLIINLWFCQLKEGFISVTHFYPT